MCELTSYTAHALHLDQKYVELFCQLFAESTDYGSLVGNFFLVDKFALV